MSSSGSNLISVFEIPLQPLSQQITATLGGITYTFTFIWRQIPCQPDQQGWFMDIGDSNNNPIINGIPLVTGADLLAQYGYLSIGGGGKLFVQSDSDPNSVPTYSNLGQTSHLYWQPAT